MVLFSRLCVVTTSLSLNFSERLSLRLCLPKFKRPRKPQHGTFGVTYQAHGPSLWSQKIKILHCTLCRGADWLMLHLDYLTQRIGLPTRAFQFGQKSFDSIRFDSRYRIDFFDSIRFANLINLPLLHWYSNSNDGEFGEKPGGVSLSCGSFCALSVSIRQFPTS